MSRRRMRHGGAGKEHSPWVGVSLNKRSALKNFTAQLEATVEYHWGNHCVAGHYHKVAGALRDLRQAVHKAKHHRADHEGDLHWAAHETKNALMEMKASSRLPEMAAYRSLFKLNAFLDLLKATDAVELSAGDLESLCPRFPLLSLAGQWQVLRRGSSGIQGSSGTSLPSPKLLVSL